MSKIKLSKQIAKQLPEFIREDYPTFIAFLEAYYEFLQAQDVDPCTNRDLDKTLDIFVDNFRKELAFNFPKSSLNERFMLSNIKDFYESKGTTPAYKFLFKLLFDKEIEVDYPSKQILRASDGKWEQEVSLMIKINAGDIDSILGQIVDVITPSQVLTEARTNQQVQVEVDRSIVIDAANGIYEIFVDRRFFGTIKIGDRIRFGGIFDATILPTTTAISYQQRGKNFYAGQLFELKNGDGAGSILKVTRVNKDGSISAAEFIQFGIGYLTDFTATILSSKGQVEAGLGTAASQFNNGDGTIVESLSGFYEDGQVNRTDYASDLGSIWKANTSFGSGTYVFWQNNLYQVTVGGTTNLNPPTHTSGSSASGTVTFQWVRPYGAAFEGVYSGVVAREFSYTTSEGVVDPDEPAILTIKLGAVARYPGYYQNNDGFLSDAMFIHDGKFYQAFSYLIRIDEKLVNYKSAIKSLIHPAGLAMFGEFNIRNEMNISAGVQSMIRSLVLILRDKVRPTAEITAKYVHKPRQDYVNTTEYTYYWMHKPLYDVEYPTAEITAKDLHKPLASATNPILEYTYFNFTKALVDSQASVANITAKNIHKPFEDGVTVTPYALEYFEEFGNSFLAYVLFETTTYEFHKDLTGIDSIVSVDSGISAVAASKTFGDTQSTNEAIQKIDLNKALEDQETPTDLIAAKDVAKALEDIAMVTGYADSFTETGDYPLNYNGYSDIHAITTNKYLSGTDTASASDNGVIQLNPYELGFYFAEDYVGAEKRFF